MRQIASCLLIGMAGSALISSREAHSQSSPPPQQTPQRQEFVELVTSAYDLVTLQPSKAIKKLDVAIEKNSRSWEAYALRASAQERLGNYELAIADYSRALEQDIYDVSEQRNIRFARARVYGDVDKHTQAIEDYTAVIDSVVDRIGFSKALSDEQDMAVNAYVARGKAHEALEQYEQAEKDYSEAVRFDPDHVTAARFLARLGFLTRKVSMI